MSTFRTDLDRKFITGVAWTTSAKWLSQIGTWAITLIVARLLAPSDYGLFGMAMVYIGLATLFSEFGLVTAIVALRDLTDDQLSQINTVSILLGCVSFTISVAAAGPVGRFFKAPGLPVVIVVISVAFLTSAFRTVPYALLTKEMRFKLMAGIDGFQAVAQAFTSLLLAASGCGYWALAVGILSSSVASMGLTLVYRRQRFAWPRRSTLLEPLRYSRDIIVSQLSWYLYDSSDFLIAGRVLGEAPLGAYTLAWTLAHVPLDKLTFIVNRLTPSLFSAVQTESQILRRYLRTITEGLSLVICPATIGIVLVAHDFVYVALGEKWQGVVLPLELLALHAFFRSNVILLAPVLNVTRGTRFGMWMNLVSLAILPASFYFGSRWGTGGIAAAWVVIYPVVQLPLFWRVFRAIDMPAREYFVSLWPAVSACAIMAVVIEVLKLALGPGWPPIARLAVEILSGIVVYLLALSLMHRARFLIFVRLLKSLGKRESRNGVSGTEAASFAG
jgi:teichuronic acid exporter